MSDFEALAHQAEQIVLEAERRARLWRTATAILTIALAASTLL